MTEQEKLGLMADITIYIENTDMIYDNVIMPVCNSLARKKFKGTYDDRKAKKAWYEVDFLTNRLIKENEKPSFVGVVKSCEWQRNDINGNGIYKVVVERCDNGNIVAGTSQHTYCFHGWLEGKKAKVFYHVTPKRKTVKFNDFIIL